MDKFLGKIGLSKKGAIIRASGLGLFLIVMVVLFALANMTLDYLLDPDTSASVYDSYTHNVRSDGWILVRQPYITVSSATGVPLALIVNLILVVILVAVLIAVALKYLFSALTISGKMSQKSMKITTWTCFGISAVLFLTLLIVACVLAANKLPSPILDSATQKPIGVKGGLDTEFNPLLKDFGNGGIQLPAPGFGQWYYWFYWTVMPLVGVFFAAAVFSGIAFFKGIFFKKAQKD
ncbi:MAG: hypothetical protein FWD58_03275 [Firmicutes bacterium]|nr:hypothetical protein [Bacillota bacterium]